MMEEESGRIFYFNIETRKVQWDAPLIKAAVVPAPKSTEASAEPGNGE